MGFLVNQELQTIYYGKITTTQQTRMSFTNDKIYKNIQKQMSTLKTTLTF